MPLLEVSNLSAGYGDAEVLFGIDLTVDRGEVVAIVGSNGAGKTTLLRTLSGIVTPTAGTVRLMDEDVTGLHAHTLVEKGIAMVPEGRRLFPRLSVRRNLEIAAYSKRARPKLAESLRAAYELFPILQERSDQLAGTLSGGQQQMVALARGLTTTPEVLLVDEVSLGLAPVMVSRVYDAIRAIRDTGMTIVLVEQNVGQALSIADRAYVVQQGRIALSGSGKELQSNEEVRRVYLGLEPAEEENQ
ncbi:high-affinity branched chain amino acid ABC transporter, ATP-binding protein [Pseudooceanicola batsensis HTCC2597]|uniref:High-affinity branched chain amino acid ABC transporter, ATP-binding protein n=1 Tax=Pseudooceanicola batsensis (strain ATCC BAA-863 / DSM 15984 / KCTC 12145 / HTCC2597) TaxID=252305 RepID=A3U1C2_PSEBH|nr:ABC transporter ATP-binding protein [Pseudooceanicola batsensis]EAQ02105.1 high-affinity branched chain amino acid ABC transporter, ATP-binding protein [Pseudooceanicola batsensis HTCC2597]